jgi:hypothetical protein
MSKGQSPSSARGNAPHQTGGPMRGVVCCSSSALSDWSSTSLPSNGVPSSARKKSPANGAGQGFDPRRAESTLAYAILAGVDVESTGPSPHCVTTGVVGRVAGWVTGRVTGFFARIAGT